MVKSTARFDVTRDMRGQGLTFWSDPINDRTLHSLGVIGPGTIGTLLNLLVTYKPTLDICKSFKRPHTKSAITITSSSEDVMSRFSKPGTDRSSSRKTERSFTCLQTRSEITGIMAVCDVHSCQALIIWSVITHRLKAIHDQRLHIAKRMDSPAKVAPMVY